MQLQVNACFKTCLQYMDLIITYYINDIVYVCRPQLAKCFRANKRVLTQTYNYIRTHTHTYSHTHTHAHTHLTYMYILKHT